MLGITDLIHSCLYLTPALIGENSLLFSVGLESTDTQQMCHSPLVSIGEVCFIYNQIEILCKRVPDSQTTGLDGGDLPI